MSKSNSFIGNHPKIIWAIAIVNILGAIYLATLPGLNVKIPAVFPFFGQTCRCFPGDPCWPQSQDWDAFNKTIGGKLIATVPIASPCHDTFEGVEFDAVKCDNIKNNWAMPAFHVESTHSVMAAFFANESCDPFSERSARCEVGSYVAYAVEAASVADYRATISFVRKHNIRLVIRNTGHDYFGKSTGTGALALWTHNIKGHSIFDFHSPTYTGKAMRVGAGVVAEEAQDAANAQGYMLVEGVCPSIGLAGGYTQGGGTSPLASKFGLGADQVLEWEVVTADGELLTATPTSNSDLYWALSGGGGGTYGAVLSMTIKLHQDMKTGGASLSFTEPSDTYWGLFQTFLLNIPAVLEAGGTVYWGALPGNTILIQNIYLPGGTAEQIQQLLKPTIDALDTSSVPYQFNAKTYDTFQDAQHALNPSTYVSELNVGGRLVPRSVIDSSNSIGDLVQAIKQIVDSGAIFAAVCLDVRKDPTSPNSVLPAWRDAFFLAFLGIPYDRTNYEFNIAAQKTVTTKFMPALEAVTPNSGAYLNEADVNQPNWQQAFYGSNYAKLLEVKRKYDPEGIFWGQKTVGSEKWNVGESGRLCRS